MKNFERMCKIISINANNFARKNCLFTEKFGENLPLTNKFVERKRTG